MNRTILKWWVMAAVGFLLWPAVAAAQESKPEVKPEPAVYRLDYVIQELDSGKRINERRYFVSTQAGRHGCQVRVGRQVPVAADSTVSGDQKHIQYMAVGMDLDCSLREQDNEVVLETSVEMSSVVTGGELALPGAPVKRQARASITSTLIPGKPTIIATLDDVDSTRSYQIEVTATKMK